jgi:prolyl-tRNA synthetase
VVAVLKPKKSEALEAGEAIYEQLLARGIEVMLDDRPLSPGAKFRDLELMGFPYVIVVGRDHADGIVEFKSRASGQTDKLAIAEAVEAVVERVTAERRGLLTD